MSSLFANRLKLACSSAGLSRIGFLDGDELVGEFVIPTEQLEGVEELLKKAKITLCEMLEVERAKDIKKLKKTGG